MNFFESQHRARRNTRAMVVLFTLAVIAIILAIDLVAAVTWLWMHAGDSRPRGAPALSLKSVPMWVWVTGALATGMAILLVSLWEILTLRAGGGAAVARMVDARRVAPNTSDPLERRLLNVVEEMAIAAGTRVPAVYIMDGESGINAFAAGYDISNTVVAVTRGTLETLNRDELQGVIGHEFSHIVNGDMSLNIRMIGVLAGIVFLGAVGGFILRNVRGGSKEKESGAIFAIGLGLFVIGYIGLFFARLIKATVSREREYLADASSVQFTRNPDGLAGALDQIRASGRDSLVLNRHAEDVSHLFFGQGISMGLGGLFDTHPPLDKRIQRVNPRFQPQGYRGSRPKVGDVTATVSPAALGFAGEGASGDPGATETRSGDTGQAWGHSPREAAALVGSVDNKKVDMAKRILAAIPASIRERVREPDGACATLVALLLAQNDAVMEEQLTAAKTAGVAKLGSAAALVAREMRGIGPAYYLPVIDLALPALKMASPESQADLLTGLQAVIHADRRVSMFEFVIFTLVRAQFSKRTGYAQPKYKSLADVRAEVLFILSLVSHAGVHRGPQAEQEFEASFRAGAKEMGLGDAKPVARGAIRMEQAGDVLAKLREVAPLPKAVLVKGLFAAVTADGSIRLIEAALMRTLGAVLDCPLPPLLEDLDPETLEA